MALKSYLNPLIKWWWMLVVSTVLAVGTTYVLTRHLAPVYQARTTLVIGNILSNTSGGDIGQAQQLAGLYTTLAQQDAIREAAREALHIPKMPAYDVHVSGNGVFIDIVVTDTDAQLAQAAANELAHQLVLKSPSAQQIGSPRIAFVNQQLDDLETGIRKTESDIQAKQTELNNATSASQIASLQADLKALQDKYSSQQTTYANLLATAPQNYTNIISIVEPATLPMTPVGPNKLLLLAVAAAAGFMLAAGTAYLLEYLDDAIKSAEEASQVFQSPVIGAVPVLEKRYAQGLYLVQQPHTPAAEAFRSLRTNLEFAGVDQPLRSILVSSAGPGDGKSTVSVNLALTMAQVGKRVVIVDADMRRPNLPTFFPVPNRPGLSDVLSGQVSLSDALRQSDEGGVTVLPAGTLPPNPAELLGSQKMEHVLVSLQQAYDVVVLDSPPFLVADAWILSAKVDGVTLVVQPGRTSRHAAHAMMEQIRRGRARLTGIVLNRDSRWSGGYYNYNHSYSARPEPDGRWHNVVAWLAKLFPWAVEASEPAPAQAVTTVEAALPQKRPSAAPAQPGKAISAQRARQALDLLAALSHEQATLRNLPELLKRVLQLTMDGVGAASGSIVVLDGCGRVLSGALAYSGEVYSPNAAALADTVERGLAGWVIDNREAVLISSTGDDPRWLARAWDRDRSRFRSAISVPLYVGENVFGAMTLVHPRAGQFAEDDLTLLRTAALCLGFNPEAMVPGNPLPCIKEQEPEPA